MNGNAVIEKDPAKLAVFDVRANGRIDRVKPIGAAAEQRFFGRAGRLGTGLHGAVNEAIASAAGLEKRSKSAIFDNDVADGQAHRFVELADDAFAAGSGD